MDMQLRAPSLSLCASLPVLCLIEILPVLVVVVISSRDSY